MDRKPATPAEERVAETLAVKHERRWLGRPSAESVRFPHPGPRGAVNESFDLFGQPLFVLGGIALKYIEKQKFGTLKKTLHWSD
ncbi:hypothetical protein B0X71_08050 [Planococcus lenghuensis]|uniref:Uncharacterized protein n=1 Tax=Planococcus lenghuensis TaxID=2213202 RepID=A0A1Q2KXY1_9BACL|nr:hypothetical protein B0X71_08050 [Planococcus lenghuensis]